MGTKRALSPHISRVLATCKEGPVLDAFAGMCSVGTYVAPARQVWANDLQTFSNTVATALFRSTDWPPEKALLQSRLLEPLHSNTMYLAQAHGDKLYAEKLAIARMDHQSLRCLFESAISRTMAPPPAEDGFYDLFTQRYAALYFSYAQCVEIDSIRCGIDSLLADNMLSIDEHRWVLIALAIAMNRCTTSTGHFAQPLAPNASNVGRICGQRKRSLLSETMKALGEIEPLGTKRWRQKNKIFSLDAIELLKHFADERGKPAVVYADPPYTDDQYSRFYHLYETLVLYDYPRCSGRGRYRGDRAVSAFSLASKVEGALNELISNAAASGADMVLSYPSEGLLPDSRNTLIRMFTEHYAQEPVVSEITHSHSTMGASKGAGAATSVVELIYRARLR